jgi:hypothetical protein
LPVYARDEPVEQEVRVPRVLRVPGRSRGEDADVRAVLAGAASAAAAEVEDSLSVPPDATAARSSTSTTR